MFDNWRLLTITKNAEGGESQTIDVFDSEEKVYEKFYDKCSQLFGNPSTARFEVSILDQEGGKIKTEKVNKDRFKA